MIFTSYESAENAIAEAVLRGVRDWGEQTFMLSQVNVPVVTGNLKSSGEFRIEMDGVHIIYHAPYAWIRENIVPKHTEQQAPRGTHYVQRAVEKSNMIESIVNSLQRLE